MDNAVCQICGKSCGPDSTLHRHLKAHKVSQVEYYQKYFPRYDKYDGKIILFKSREYYFSNDFNSRLNLHKWLDTISKDEARTYIRKWFQDRKSKKDLRYTMSQVELRSLLVPAKVYLSKLFGDYEKFSKELGFQSRFSRTNLSVTSRSFLPHHSIYCDTREQTPLTFRMPSETRGLSFGDYRLNDDDFTHNCVIERKSMSDFFGTMSQGYERFGREIERARDAGFYLVVLVEAPMTAAADFALDLKQRNIRLSLEYVMHNMRALCQQYDNVQFLFVNDRQESSEAIERIFASNGEFKQVDLQYLYDKKELI